MSDDVRVVMRLKAKKETVDQLKQVLFDLSSTSSKEDGCQSYKVFLNQSDPLDLVLYETWRDQASVDAHLKTAHVQQAFAKGLPLLAGAPDRQVYTAIDRHINRPGEITA